MTFRMPFSISVLGGVFSLVLHAAALGLILVGPGLSSLDLGSEDEIYLVDLMSSMEEGPGGESLAGEQTEPGSIAPEEEPPPVPEVKEISPVKDDALAQGNVTRPSQKVYFGDGILKQGNEVRLSLRSIDIFNYGETDYTGHYQVSGKGTFVSVMFSPDNGRLVFYDSESGLFRTLTKMSKFIYTYGPSFAESEPVEGSITFMPHRDWEDRDITGLPSRLMWIKDNSPMRVASKIRFQEVGAAFKSDGVSLAGRLLVREEMEDMPAVVWVPGPECGPDEMSLRFARVLALHGIVVLMYDPRGCGASGGEPGGASPQQLARDLLAGAALLKTVPGVDPDRIGLWADQARTGVALMAAEAGPGISFLVHTDVEGVEFAGWDLSPMPDISRLAGVRKPMLWLFAGRAPEKSFHGHIMALQGLGGVRVELVTSDQDWGERSQALKVFSPAYVKLAVPWILNGGDG